MIPTSNYVKKLIRFRFDRYKDTESRLEALAAQGLFLNACGSVLWTFKKGEPRKLNYAITLFPEGSIYDPDITVNQQTYLDYAEAAGWKLVTQHNQMHVFSNEASQPVPFETDEREKLNNIKACMRKSFVFPMLILILMFMLDLVMHVQSLQRNPIDFLSNSSQLLSAFMNVTVLIYEVYSLLNYFIWCRRSERQIAGGGECISNTSPVYRVVDITFVSFICGCLAYFLFNLLFEISWFGLLLCVMQMPVLWLLFSGSIQYFKKIKASASLNKVISITILLLANVAYLSLLMVFIMRFDFVGAAGSDYRTVTWQITPEEESDYRLYSDSLPLTCEDLYGETDYEYYSYEKRTDHTWFLTRNTFRQSSLPARDAPPEIEYEVLNSSYVFAFELAKKTLLTVPSWREQTSYRGIDNEIFGTVEAYQEYHGEDPMGGYILIFENKIITLRLDAPADCSQVETIRKNLLTVTEQVF